MPNNSTPAFVSTFLPYVPAVELAPLFETTLKKVAAEDVAPPELVVLDSVFPRSDAAVATLYKAVMPGQAIAVRIGNERELFTHPSNRVHQKLSARVARSCAAAESYLQHVVERELERAKKKFQKMGRAHLHECANCQSRVNLATHLKGLVRVESKCPVCAAELLMTNRDAKRYASLCAAHAQAIQDLESARVAHSKSHSAPVWLVLENRKGAVAAPAPKKGRRRGKA